MNIEFTARARAFTGYPVQEHRFHVDPSEKDPQVWVWDSAAGHFTTCHALSAGQQRRLIRIALQQSETPK